MKKKLFNILCCSLAILFTACEPKEPSNKSEVSGTSNGHEYVDLGLSVKWATTNVGAKSPEDYGDYFAWGETKPKSSYDCKSYKWWDHSQQYLNITKYCIDPNYGKVDNKIELELEDDAANANWGDEWRMPTTKEFIELKDNCTWLWTSQNGVIGYKVTSNKNGKSIFLPAAGGRTENGELVYDGKYGTYWSCSLSQWIPDEPYQDYHAKAISLELSNSNAILTDGYIGASRDTGLSIRPVFGKKNPSIYEDKEDNEDVIPDGDYTPDDDDIYNEEIYEDIPYIQNPSADKTTLLFQIENAACDYFELYLMGIDGIWYDRPEMKFERVEGTTTWFIATIDALDDAESNFKIRANGDWVFEPKAGYEFLNDSYDYVVEGADGGNPNNLMMINNAGGKVLALKVIKFSTPCIEREHNKAGEATFTLTVTYPLPEGAVIGIVGSINEEELYWNIAAPITMTKNEGNTWTAKVEVPDDFEYKYVYSLDGGITWNWDYIEDGNNREMPLDLKAVDTVEEWNGLPYEEYN